MEIEKLSLNEIENMDYNQIIGLVKETNRPPGGKNSIFEIINRLHLNEKSKILEIGTSTGFTSVEISKLLRCDITSIDINEDSLKEAKTRAESQGYSNIKFQRADVNSLPFTNEEFDLVIVGNVFSLMENKKRALNECMRVVKSGGFIVAIPMYYLKTPPEDIVKRVSKAIKVNVIPMYKEDWLEFFSIPELEIYWSKNFRFDYVKDEVVFRFCEDILKRKHLQDLSKIVSEKLKNIYPEFMMLFRDNLSHMGYSIMILSKKKIWEDPELFTGSQIE